MMMQRTKTPGPTGGGGGGGGQTVNADVIRWDGNTGSVKVSTAWPLKPGVMFAGDMTKLLVRDDTSAEVAIGVSASRGLFPDGSLRCVHVQFTANLTNNTAKTYTVEIGGTTRTTANDISYVETIYTSGTASIAAANHRAVMIPANSQYWCDTFIALTPLQPEASDVSDSMKTYFQTANGTSSTLGEWASWIDSHTTTADLGASATYEHAHGFLCAAIRANSQAKRIAFYKRFYDFMYDGILTTYLAVNSSADSSGGNVVARVGTGVDASLPTTVPLNGSGLTSEPRSGMAMSLACLYLATGWKQPWRHLCHLSNWTWGTDTYATARDYYVAADQEPRFNVSMRMMFRFAAYVVGATMQVGNGSGGYGAGRDNDVALWTHDLPWSLDALVDYSFTAGYSTGYATGVVGCRPDITDGGSLPAAGRFPTFQLQIVTRALMFYYNNIDDDSRIPTLIQTLADFVVNQIQDHTTFYTIPYCHDPSPASVTYDGTEHSVDGFGVVVNKNEVWYVPFFSELMGAAYAFTGTSTYKTWALRCANARELDAISPFTPTVKGFGEYFGGHMQSAKFYIDGGTVRPISGAHPTSITTRVTYTS